MTVEERLEKIEALLGVLAERPPARKFYDIAEFALRAGRSRFTVQSWARCGRIQATKKLSGRGAHLAWAISHEELLRYEREGLLPRKARGVES